jgi:hopanoid biosynthesis associated protein HpnK
VQRQVEAELRAQLEAFRATGLVLDHVNAHHHFHLHPTVLRLILRLAPEYGIKAVRVPHEPFWPSWRAARVGFGRRLGNALFHARRTRAMKRALARAGIVANDAILGLNDSGAMDRHRVGAFLDHLPQGVTELYCHPAMRRWPGPDTLPDTYRCVEEFEALIDADIARKLRTAAISLVSFRDLASP